MQFAEEHLPEGPLQRRADGCTEPPSIAADQLTGLDRQVIHYMLNLRYFFGQVFRLSLLFL